MDDQPSDLASALNELDYCSQTMESMRVEIAELRELLKRTTDMLSAFTSLHPVATPPKKGRGRPQKVTSDIWLLDAFDKMKTEFMAVNKLEKPTDSAVITWYFAREFLRLDMRESKARSPAFQSKLKRLKNRLGDIRNPIRTLPIK